MQLALLDQSRRMTIKGRLLQMSHSVTSMQISDPAAGSDTLCRQGSLALLALRTRYGLTCVNIDAMDRITAVQVAATLEFLHNNLPGAT